MAESEKFEDMTNKTVIVTGGSSGIGLETAVALAKDGARVIITARDQARGDAALETIRERSKGSGRGTCELVLFDLGSMASVRKGAAEILANTERIDVLINNAGLVLSQRSETEDGFESTIAINHLGPFLLTELLLERIKQSAPARIVNVSSTAHNGSKIDFDDLQSKNGYRGMKVYGESKLANIYFTTELARRLEGTGVTVNCLHPGLVRTGYGKNGDTSGILQFGIHLASPFMITPIQGAYTSVYLATSPDVANVSGKYFAKCKERSPSRIAGDPDAAKRLWDISEDLVSKAGL